VATGDPPEGGTAQSLARWADWWGRTAHRPGGRRAEGHEPSVSSSLDPHPVPQHPGDTGLRKQYRCAVLLRRHRGNRGTQAMSACEPWTVPPTPSGARSRPSGNRELQRVASRARERSRDRLEAPAASAGSIPGPGETPGAPGGTAR